MANKEFVRKQKEQDPVVAICYDFDKTLTPDDMQAQGYIQSVGYAVGDFWKESNSLATDNEMDQNLAYMYMMKQESEGKILFTKQGLLKYGADVKLFPGVAEWFDRIRKYGAENGVLVEHYIISSGLKEMIEGTSVAKAGAFEKIYASSFYYNEKGVAVWPAQVVNYTNKTQFLFRIEKGVLDINDPAVNEYFPPEAVRVPFRNMIYIGDSDTDIPCMKLVKSYGGHSIGVYNAETKEKTKVYQMMRDGRVNYFVPADYTEGKELDALVKAIIDRTVTNEALEAFHYKNKAEQMEVDKGGDEEKRKKAELVMALESSGSFATTHSIIAQLQQFVWSKEEAPLLLRIACRNNQVGCILGDSDVSEFYEKILSSLESDTEDAQHVRELMQIQF